LLVVSQQEIRHQFVVCGVFPVQVFEECRNLCLGLASRGVNWRQQGLRGTLAICIGLSTKLFANLMTRCDNIAVAMTARGFQGPERHVLHNIVAWEATQRGATLQCL
jgi:energy-coupling factor transporter transmembrane protein EcfT